MLLFRLKRFIPAIFVFWSLAITLSFFIGYSTIGHSLLSSYFSYFLTGALISEFYRTRYGWIIPVLALSIFTNIAYAYRQVPDHIVEFTGGVNSPMIAASIVTVFIALIMLIGLPQATRIRLPWAQEVGALTYPIYLLHAHIGYILLSHLASNENRLIPYLGVFILILLLAWLLHRTVEVKMGPHIKRFLDRALDSIPYPRKAR